MRTPEPLPVPRTLADARRILRGHRRGEAGAGFRHADRLADALELALREIDARPGEEAA